MNNVVERVYGFAFPTGLYAFHEFWKKHAPLFEDSGLGVVGPFDLLANAKAKVDPGGDWPRFYNDPPELFTVMVGDTDGLHWGYSFDDTSSEPVVASYYGNDAFEMSEHPTLFHALREDLELRVRDALDYAETDRENAADYEARLEKAGRARQALSRVALSERKETGAAYVKRYLSKKTSRKVVAKTRHHMGIVVPKNQYRALAAKDPFEKWNYVPKARDVKAMMKKARDLADEGKPGAALKLGQDLWGYAAFHDASAEMLDLAYEKLGRPVLRDYLTRAMKYRRKCDAKRR
jgi:hypothetical protein